MSSSYVRSQVKNFITNSSGERLIDLTARFDDIREMIKKEGLTPSDPWLGITFLGDSELPVSLTAKNDQGLYREMGQIFLHVVAEARLGVGDSLVQRGEILRNLFRGSRIGDVVIEEVGTLNTGSGAALEFESGYIAGTISIGYYRDLNL